MKHKQKLKKYKAIIKFKHLPWWYKTQIVEAKSEKKVRDIILHMYKDDVLSLEIKEISSPEVRTVTLKGS